MAILPSVLARTCVSRLLPDSRTQAIACTLSRSPATTFGSMELTIAAATSIFFSAADLAMYPESLLNTAFESQPEGSAGMVCDFARLALPTHKFPHISRAAVAGLVHGVYRDGKMAANLDNLITHVKSAQSAESTRVYEMLHEELSRLLDYFRLPAAVTGYLPPLNTLDLQQQQLISFTYTAYGIEQARMVVGAMLSYKPHQAADQPRGAAAFLVTANTSATPPVEKVYVLLSPPEQLLSAMQECDGDPLAFSYVDPYHPTDGRSILFARATIMCEKSDLAEAEVHSLDSKDRTEFVSAKDKWLGQHLVRALATHKPNGLKTVCCGIRSQVAYDHYDIPVWVLVW